MLAKFIHVIQPRFIARTSYSTFCQHKEYMCTYPSVWRFLCLLATNQTRHAVAVHMYLRHSVATTQHEEDSGNHCEHASVTSNIV